MLKQWNKKPTWIVAVIVLIGVLLYSLLYWTLIRPLNEEVKSYKSEVHIYETRIDNLNGQENSDLSDDLAEIAKKVPMKESLDNMLLNFHEIASQTGIEITNIAAKETQDESVNHVIEGLETEGEDKHPFQHSSYELEAIATSLTAINAFMDQLQQSERLFIIDTINLNQSESNVQATLTISVFYIK